MSSDPDDAYDRWRDDIAAGLDVIPRPFRLDHPPIEPVERPASVPRERPAAHDNNSPRMQALRATAGRSFFSYSRGR